MASSVKVDPVWWHRKFYTPLHHVLISNKGLKFWEVFYREYFNDIGRMRFSNFFHHRRGIGLQCLQGVIGNKEAHIGIAYVPGCCLALGQEIDLGGNPPHIDCLGRVRVVTDVIGNPLQKDIPYAIFIRYAV